MQDVGQSEALAKQSVKCEKRAFSCEKYGLDFDLKRRNPTARSEGPGFASDKILVQA
jgi:hypothetical protein